MYKVDTVIKDRIKALLDNDPVQFSGTVPVSGVTIHSAKALFANNLLDLKPSAQLFIVEDDTMISVIAKELSIWSNYPIFPIDKDSVSMYSKKVIAQLMSVLFLNKPSIVVTTWDIANNMLLPSVKDIKANATKLKVGDEIDFMEIFNTLIEQGYSVSESMILSPGTYVRKGGIIDIFPINSEHPLKIELFDTQIEQLYYINQRTQEVVKTVPEALVLSMNIAENKTRLRDYFTDKCIIWDEVDIPSEMNNPLNILFTPFTDEEVQRKGADLHYTSVLRFHTPIEFTDYLRKKIDQDWHIVIFSQDQDKVWGLLLDQGIKNEDLEKIDIIEKNGVLESTQSEMLETDSDFDKEFYDALMKTDEREFSKKVYFPESFQSDKDKVLVITDKEIFGHFETRRSTKAQADTAFLANLNPGDYVVHIDHGIGRFVSVETKTVDKVTREYLNIEYAKGDRLYVPVDQADKINKYIGATGGSAPNLTRLGSAEWSTVSYKARQETLEMAKELLELYALRETAKGIAYSDKNFNQKMLETFIKGFPYVETPGQLKAWTEIQKDMAKERPMDRLLCGDVGFGKTEIAMRAAVNAVAHGKQVAFIAPITILADQHFRSFARRTEGLDIRIGMLSRFSTPQEQRKVIAELKEGKVDVVIGTHRLLQPDVDFKDIGLVIIDEEQRFGVKQKERFKQLRHEVDILSLTATPIPRTLNLGLSGLRDISTITTPPPGRLPIVTEVRRYSMHLIRDCIMRELEREGQVYVLHNRVQTIESMAEKLRNIVPEAKFIVAHGKLASHDLEERILAFKQHKYDVLVSSTIIENGIDLPNANTLIVDRAEQLGLAQAYQLRGRVGRGKKQAYAYFLYHSQKLDDTAKKRLRAIVEASELGSGFQIAMRDLEIRGAGDILGAKQHGSINAVGVSHFTRLLKQAVEDIKKGKTDTEILEKPLEETAIELPVTAYIPKTYIERSSEKLKFYQRLAGCNNTAILAELHEEMQDIYGPVPPETENLFSILRLKIIASDHGIVTVKEGFIEKRPWIELILSKKVTPKAIVNLLEYNDKWSISGQTLMIDKSYLSRKWIDELSENILALKTDPSKKEQLVSNRKQKELEKLNKS